MLALTKQGRRGTSYMQLYKASANTEIMIFKSLISNKNPRKFARIFVKSFLRQRKLYVHRPRVTNHFVTCAGI